MRYQTNYVLTPAVPSISINHLPPHPVVVCRRVYEQCAEGLCFLQPRAQPRPVIPTPAQGRLVMPGQAQVPRARSMQVANGYAPAVQPGHAEEAYVAAAVPARQAYTETVRRYSLHCLVMCVCLQLCELHGTCLWCQPGLYSALNKLHCSVVSARLLSFGDACLCTCICCAETAACLGPAKQQTKCKCLFVCYRWEEA